MCNCKINISLIERNPDIGLKVDIIYCPTHKAAPDMLEALKEIAKMEGPYSRDPLTHAENVIENLTNIANKAIANSKNRRKRVMEKDEVFFHAEDEMIRLANVTGRDYKYYCPHCDFWYKPSEVKEQDDGISDTICPDCGKPLQEEENGS